MLIIGWVGTSMGGLGLQTNKAGGCFKHIFAKGQQFRSKLAESCITCLILFRFLFIKMVSHMKIDFLLKGWPMPLSCTEYHNT